MVSYAKVSIKQTGSVIDLYEFCHTYNSLRPRLITTVSKVEVAHVVAGLADYLQSGRFAAAIESIIEVEVADVATAALGNPFYKMPAGLAHTGVEYIVRNIDVGVIFAVGVKLEGGGAFNSAVVAVFNG